LLRHTDVAVEFGRSQPLSVEELACVTSLPQLSILVAREFALSEAALAELLRRDGCLPKLHTLLLYESNVNVLTDQTALVAERLPHLRALGFCSQVFGNGGLRSGEALACLQQLTALRLCTPSKEVLADVQRLPHLRTLQLVDCRYPEWLAELRTPALRSLKQLDLSGPVDYYGRWSLEPEDVDAAFANLSGLERLTLHQFNYARQVLPAITAHCAALHQLYVEPVELYRSTIAHRGECCVPDLAQLQAFLHARSQCAVLLGLVTLGSYYSHRCNVSTAWGPIGNLCTTNGSRCASTHRCDSTCSEQLERSRRLRKSGRSKTRAAPRHELADRAHITTARRCCTLLCEGRF